MMEFFECLGVDTEISDMSLSVSLDQGRGCEWGTRNGLSSLFAQKKNVLNPYFWQMIREISRFKQDVISYLEAVDNNLDIDRNETLGQFIKSHGYSELFQKAYLIPICASIWPCPLAGVLGFSAYYILLFCRDHHLLQIFDLPQLLTVRWRAQTYVNKVKEELEKRGCQIRTGCEVNSVSTNEEGCTIACNDGAKEVYDRCIIAANASDTLTMLGKEATYDESRILGAFQYVYSDTFLHRDKTFLPRNPGAWSACNFVGTMNDRACVTYWLNIIQNLGDSKLPYLVTLDPPHKPEDTLLKWTTGHPVPSVAASKASRELHQIQGKRGIWFCGEYQGYGFHEDGLKAGMVAADGMLRRNCSILDNPKQMVPTWTETGARLLVTRFLKSFIETGCIILLEEGGTIFTFQGTEKKCSLKVLLRIHSTQFYWKVATQADLGLADSFIHGDFSFVDKSEGLLNLLMIFVANRDMKASVKRSSKKRGWWTPLLFTAALSSAKYFIQHVSNQNTLTQARRNISRHYDLSNELFSLFLDETMTYSCAIFESEDEDLKVAQLRKISRLIRKANISAEHHILEIGFGWGSLAIEAVKQTGCKYTGITLSEQQLKYAQLRVEQAGLQDQITFLLCDYRQIPNKDKYDRIISCGMLEHVGHDFIREFFACCESALAEDGLLVLQFISIPDERYDEYRQSSDFIKEYIFPGGCLPALSRVTSAMAAASRLCVEHLEEIGIHYYQTLRCWRKNFLENKSQIRALGFDDKFIRTWEYYFDYCAAGFKTCTIGDYQIVFSRPGNVAIFGDPYNYTPSAYYRVSYPEFETETSG
ncbi:cfs1-like protein [Datura stramonium]|uniref:Cfs1-like protein n=1 Tax=Datura stramonium TaxID=4076 RepID=A0ABS8WNR3_DATST|nr:cfs1-like protein [Datura stramonium]